MSPPPRGPYRFDQARADRVCLFFEKLLVHTKDRWSGQPFVLLPWQRDGLRYIFGWVHEDTGRRMVRTAYWEIPKKNGKSELAAGVGLYLTGGDGVIAAEVVSAAGDRDQAAIVHNVARDMVQLSPALASRYVPYRKSIEYPKDRGTYKVLSAEAFTKHGYNLNGVIFDELHVQSTRELWDTLTAGTAARAEPLTFAITTAGYDRTTICWEQHEYARQILDGLIVDPTYFALIAAADETDDWTSEETWAKANPSLGVTIDIEFLRAEARKAKAMPAAQNTFRRLHLNQWTSQDVRWLDMGRWDLCGRIRAMDDLRGGECYGGLAIPSPTGIAAYVVAVADPRGGLDVVPFFFLPEENIDELASRDGAPYRAWVEGGYIEVTPGDVVDLDYVEARIRQIAKDLPVTTIGYDRRQALQLVTHLDSEFEFFHVPQGYALNAPMRELETVYLNGTLRHGAHPVLRWMADNAYAEENASKEIKLSHKKGTKPTAGIKALIHAIDRMSRVDQDAYRGSGMSIAG